ncbi:hypothetical protein [Pseudarthrobacter sp. J64]|uniref:hypothetical protein n=1 Tax=Pseudarthrobacter sp. J64 TaxID=3116485 RepID=UPI003FA7625B
MPAEAPPAVVLLPSTTDDAGWLAELRAAVTRPDPEAATDAALAKHPDLGERLGKDGIAVRDSWCTGLRSPSGTAATRTCCTNASTAVRGSSCRIPPRTAF